MPATVVLLASALQVATSAVAPDDAATGFDVFVWRGPDAPETEEAAAFLRGYGGAPVLGAQDPAKPGEGMAWLYEGLDETGAQKFGK